MEWLLSLIADPAAVAAAVLCGFIIGWLICFTGVGGGVLVIPALAFFFNLPVSLAVGTASAYTTLTKLMAGAEHIRIRNVNYGLFLRLTGWALPGLLTSALIINYLLSRYPEYEAQVQTVLRGAVIGVILLSFLLIWRGSSAAGTMRQSRLALCGGAIGLIMGATGIGGGVLIAPVLLLAGETPKRVVGTSILIALALSGLTAALYSAGGQLSLSLAIWMSAGSLLALPIASRTLRRAPEAVVKKSLLILILIAVALMLLDSVYSISASA